MPHQPANPRARKLVGSLALLLFVVVYTLLAMWIGANFVNQQHGLVQLIFYVAAGVAWAFPAFRIIKWSSPPTE